MNKCQRGEDEQVYILSDEGHMAVQFSKKDTEIQKFLFDFTNDVYFKSFVDCKPDDIDGRKPYY